MTETRKDEKVRRTFYGHFCDIHIPFVERTESRMFRVFRRHGPLKRGDFKSSTSALPNNIIHIDKCCNLGMGFVGTDMEVQNAEASVVSLILTIKKISQTMHVRSVDTQWLRYLHENWQW